MKSLLAVTLWVFTFSAVAGELKVATVDLQRLLAEYHRAQEVGKQLREKQSSFQKELEGLRLEGRTLIRETDELQKLSLDNALSASEREAKKRAFEGKVADLRAFEVRYDTVRSQRETELQTFATQNNKRVIDDILSVTRTLAEKQGINLVLNASRANPIGSDVLYSKGVDDLTDHVLVSLNARKP
jgi:outer membrane protein